MSAYAVPHDPLCDVHLCDARAVLDVWNAGGGAPDEYVGKFCARHANEKAKELA